MINAVLTAGSEQVDIGFPAYPLVDPRIVADVQNNLSNPEAGTSTGLTAEDARRIAQKVVGLAGSNIIPDVPVAPSGGAVATTNFHLETGLVGMASVPVAASPPLVMSFGTPTSLVSGQSSTISVVLNRAPTSGENFRYADVQIAFDPTAITPSELVQRAALTTNGDARLQWDIQPRKVGNVLVFSAYAAKPIDAAAAMDLRLYLVNLLAQSSETVRNTSLSMGPITVVDRTRQLPETGLPYQYSTAPVSLTVQPLNSSPTNLTLSANTIAENTASGTVIGTFSTTDPDAGNTFTYSPVAPGVNVDNQAFSIVGNQLRSFAVLNFEAKSSYSIVVRTTDQGGLFFDRTFTINVTNVNETPMALNLSGNTIAENSVSGTVIGTITTSDPDAGNTFVYSLVNSGVNVDNQAFSIVGNQLRSFAVFDFEAKSSYSVVVRTTDQGNLSLDRTFTVNVADLNETGAGNSAPVLDASGNPFAILGAGSRQSTEMRQGVLVSEILTRGAGGNPISDPDAGALRGIALTAVDQTFGNFQFTLVTNNPQESDWVNVDAAGALSNSNALLLPITARLRFTTGRIPHHASAPFFLSVESRLDTGLTFRAWDQTSGAAGGRADTSTNGGTSAFSAATETSKVYFEVRLFRSFNPNAGLNVYTLEAEFNALTGGAFQDRSTSAYTGFTVLLSHAPELGTSALFRLYFGIQFNDNGTEVDMGYRYLTSNGAEAEFLESIGPASKRPQREGTYFREQGVSNGTATIGYVFNTQQPGTSQLTQIYRTDVINKPTRPPGTAEGGTPTSFTPQENGDHVYTTNTAFETTKPGTWRIESPRGFVRELTPSPVSGGATAAAVAAATGERTTETALVDFAAATETSTSYATASATLRSATVQSSLPVLSPQLRGLPLVADPGNDNIDRLIADHVSHHGSDSAVDRPDNVPTPHETSARDTVLAAPARSRTVSTSVNLEFLDEAFLDQAFVDKVTFAI